MLAGFHAILSPFLFFRNLTIVAKQTKSSQSVSWLGIPARHIGPVLALTGLLLYAQTVSFEYTQDDAIVIYENMFTTEGISGIPGLFGHDTFYGYFKDESKLRLVSGGRYRPLTPAMFAVEWAIAGPHQPWLSHLMNAVWYGLLCWVLFGFLRALLTPRLSSATAVQVAGWATLLFALHPIHTEVVANIKGRDEIIAALGAIGGLWLMLKSQGHAKSTLLLVGSAIAFFLGMLSKENVVTMLGVAPLTLWWYHKKTSVKWLRNLAPILVASAVFILLRGAVTGWDPGETPKELLNNPFVKVENSNYVPFTPAEKSATIVYTMGKYLQLLAFPYPLTHDYYPRHIDIQHWGKPLVLLSLLVWLGLLFAVIKGWKDRTWWAYAIMFYVMTMSVTSNIIFPVGTNMSERFAFLPSVGFALAVGLLIVGGLQSGKWKMAALAIVTIYMVGFAGYTLMRSRVWKDNSTLFSTDVHTSRRSAKLLNAAGGDLITRAEKEADEKRREQMLSEAQGYLKQALEIHPSYKLGYLLLGNSYFHLKDYDSAITYFRHVLKLDPGYRDGQRNLGVALREKGKIEGEKNKNLSIAISLLQEALQYLPEDPETRQLLGVAYGQGGDVNKAITYFREVIRLAPEYAMAYYNLGIALRQAGDLQGAEENIAKARSLDPNLPQMQNR